MPPPIQDHSHTSTNLFSLLIDVALNVLESTARAVVEKFDAHRVSFWLLYAQRFSPYYAYNTLYYNLGSERASGSL